MDINVQLMVINVEKQGSSVVWSDMFLIASEERKNIARLAIVIVRLRRFRRKKIGHAIKLLRIKYIWVALGHIKYRFARDGYRSLATLSKKENPTGWNGNWNIHAMEKLLETLSASIL